MQREEVKWMISSIKKQRDSKILGDLHFFKTEEKVSLNFDFVGFMLFSIS